MRPDHTFTHFNYSLQITDIKVSRWCMVTLGASTCCHWAEWFFYLVQREMVYLIDLILASAMTNMWIIRSLNKTRQDIYYRNINKFLVTQLAKTLVVACQINECRRLHHLSPHNDFVALFLLQRLPYHFVWSRHAFLLWWEQKLQITCFAGVDSFAASSLRMIFVVKQAADVFCWFQQ